MQIYRHCGSVSWCDIELLSRNNEQEKDHRSYIRNLSSGGKKA